MSKHTASLEQFYLHAAKTNLEAFCCLMARDYAPNWHHRVILQTLERVERGEVKRVMIFLPPRHGKSQIASIFFPAWFLGRNPGKEIITASYAQELAQDFGTKTRDIVQDTLYRQIFGVTLRQDEQSKAKWATEQGGTYTSVGVGGAITGRGANCLLLDDIYKNREEAESETIREKVWNWYTSTAYTRLEPNGAIVLIQTRWHTDDLAGRLLAQSGEKWEVIEFPAIAEQDEKHRKQGEALWCDRYSLADIERIKREIGIYDFSSLYQQKPITTAAQEFKQEWLQYITMAQVREKQTSAFMAIDSAISEKASADYTGIAIAYVDSLNNWYVRAYHIRCNPKELIDLLFTFFDNLKLKKIGIEKTIYLQAIKPFLDDEMRRRNVFLPIVPLEHQQTAKETRIRGLIPRYSSKSVWHIQGMCGDLEEEMFTFPKGVHDDVLDALAYMQQIAYIPDGGYVGETDQDILERMPDAPYIDSQGIIHSVHEDLMRENARDWRR